MTTEGAGVRLNAALAEAGLEPLDEKTTHRFEDYLSLILRWNVRLNLTALRTEDAIIINHLCESVACAKAIPDEVTTLLDFGSGAGLPGIPIALCRTQIAVTLAERHGKKAAFLQEAVRTLGIRAKVYGDRAETLSEVFDCVTLRAVDKMPKAVTAGAKLVQPRGWLALMTTNAGLAELQAAAGAEFSWLSNVPLPGSRDKIVALGQRERDRTTSRSGPGRR
jgi:16S rRNA (guanine527-N7)-methyltransferase